LRGSYLVVIVIVAIGTYLMRFLPMRFKGTVGNIVKSSNFLKHSSTAIVSALFLTSLVSFPTKLGEILTSLLALALVFLSYRKWRNLGISIMVGIVSHFSFNILLR